MKIYIGIDPGFSGAIAAVTGQNAWCWDMPIDENGVKKEIDFANLLSIFNGFDITHGDGGHAGLEWNTTRPGEPPEPAYRFGLQTGALAMGLTAAGIQWQKVSPQAWKNHYNIHGKDKDPHSIGAQEAWRGLNYPEHDLIYGPKGGILDGRLDALLIAEYIRRQHESIRPVQRGGLEAVKAVLTAGPRGRPGGKRLPRI